MARKRGRGKRNPIGETKTSIILYLAEGKRERGDIIDYLRDSYNIREAKTIDRHLKALVKEGLIEKEEIGPGLPVSYHLASGYSVLKRVFQFTAKNNKELELLKSPYAQDAIHGGIFPEITKDLLEALGYGLRWGEDKIGAPLEFEKMSEFERPEDIVPEASGILFPPNVDNRGVIIQILRSSPSAMSHMATLRDTKIKRPEAFLDGYKRYYTPIFLSFQRRRVKGEDEKKRLAEAIRTACKDFPPGQTPRGTLSTPMRIIMESLLISDYLADRVVKNSWVNEYYKGLFTPNEDLVEDLKKWAEENRGTKPPGPPRTLR